MPAIRVLLAEDHRTVRESLRLMLEQQSDLEVVGEAGTGKETLRQVQLTRPDIVVMDVAMPEWNGLTVARALRRTSPQTKIVTLTRYSDEAYFRELRSAGVAGYVLKQSPSEELLHAIRAVAGGSDYVDRWMAARASDRARLDVLMTGERPSISERESQVLRHIAWGLSNREIATKLRLSVKTIEAHRANAMRKLGIASRLDIVRFALLQGWLQEM